MFWRGVGVAGWSIVDKKLVDPVGRARDFMSYCGPVWVSDYTYNGLYERMVDVAKAKRTGLGGGPVGGGSGSGAGTKTMTRMRSYHVDADGSLREGPLADVVPNASKSGGIVMRYEDASGKTVAVSNAAYRPYDSMPGGLLLAGEPPAGATRALVDGLAGRPLELRRR